MCVSKPPVLWRVHVCVCVSVISEFSIEEFGILGSHKNDTNGGRAMLVVGVDRESGKPLQAFSMFQCTARTCMCGSVP